MTAASKISKRGNESAETPLTDRQRAIERRRLRRDWYRLFAVPDVRHRRREARRWLEEMTVRITNPPFSQQRRGERLFETVAERIAVSEALKATLRKEDPELLRAVDRLEFEDFARGLGITFAEWKRRSARRSARLSIVRAEMRAAGLI